MENLLQRGLPLSLSRWTDVAHWYKPWLCDLITRQGFVFAPDPEDGLFKKWSLHPEEVHSLFFWTKNPSALLTPLMSWLTPYRVFTAVTITCWDEEEPGAPGFEAQLAGLQDLVALVGASSVRVRFSPVPTDLFVNPVREEKWYRLCEVVEELELLLDVSLLHDVNLPYQGGTRQDILSSILQSGPKVGLCGKDAELMSTETYRQSQCLDGPYLANLYGISNVVKKEAECACLMSVDPCLGPKFGCGSRCSYCYAPYTRGLEER